MTSRRKRFYGLPPEKVSARQIFLRNLRLIWLPTAKLKFSKMEEIFMDWMRKSPGIMGSVYSRNSEFLEEKVPLWLIFSGPIFRTKSFWIWTIRHRRFCFII